MNKKQLYESIIESVAKEVKKALNEAEQIESLEQDHDDAFIDLGLTSGTLWRKYNLGATCGETAESWYGDYYQWGKTQPCTYDNYVRGGKHWDDLEDRFFERRRGERGRVDDDYNLLPDYDAAYRAGGLVHMPTYEQIKELIKETSNKWVTNYNGINNLNGRVFIGKNGNELFVPAAGYVDECGFRREVDDICCMWSKTLYLHNGACSFCFDNKGFNSDFKEVDINPRYFGFSVREVLEK